MDKRITPQMLQRWNPLTAFNTEKYKCIEDPIERRLQMIEDALLDMGTKLNAANEVYAHLNERLLKTEIDLRNYIAGNFTSDEVEFIIDVFNKLKPETKGEK